MNGRIRRLVSRVGTVVPAVVWAAVASAQVTTFTSQSAFLAALAPGGVTNTFPDGPVGNYSTPAPPLRYAVGSPYAPYTVWVSTGLFGDNYTIGGQPVQGIGNFQFSQPMYIDFTGHNVRQVGASFFFTDFFGAAVPGDVVVEFYDGSSATVPLVTGSVPTNTGSTGGPNFFGVSVANPAQAIRGITVPRFPVGTEAYINMGPLTTSAFPDIALVWAGGGDPANPGGDGTWNTSSSNWATGPAASATWQTARRAVFAGSGGAVSVDAGGVSVSRGLAFNGDGFSVSGPGAVILSGTTAAGNDVYVGPGLAPTVGATVSAASGFVKSGPGTLVITGTATGGPVTISRGVLQVGDGGTTGVLAAGSVVNNAELEFSRSDSHAYAGAISGTGAVFVTGAGRTTLSGSNNFSGQTAILSEGTLAIPTAAATAGSVRVSTGSAGTFDVSAIAGGYAVPAAQTLVGSGTVAGSASAAAGATLSPGVGRGTLTFTETLTMGAGGNLNWQIEDGAGTAGQPGGWDLLNVNGALSIAATSAGRFNVNLWSVLGSGASGPALGFDPLVSSTYTIATAAGGITGFAVNKFTVNTGSFNGTAGFVNGLEGGTFRVAQSGNNLNLVFSPAGSGPTAIVIDVASGTQTQSAAGYPLLTPDNAASVTKTGLGTVSYTHLTLPTKA